MAKKCPLCGGKLEKNYCDSCGYTVPSAEDISALYNMDPDDYPQPEPVREIYPERDREEVYPNRTPPPRFKVRDDEGNTYRQDGGTANSYGGRAENPYAQQAPPPPPPVFNLPPQGTPEDTLNEFIKKYWWLLLVSFFFPGLGLILMIINRKHLNPKFRWVVIAAIIVGTIFPPYS